MYKLRDNAQHPPTTLDPSGAGILWSTSPAGADGAAPPQAAGPRKRGRDIRGIDRFRQVIYSDDGFPRLHAMVARNPILMYPPAGAPQARQHVLARAEASAAMSDEAKAQQEDAALRAMLDEQRQAEAAVEDASHGRVVEPSSAAPPQLHPAIIEEQAAHYHHQQLDVFIKLLYEFNHMTLVKLPMEDTLQLLARCGKEAAAHVMEYEMQVRMKRYARLAELRSLHAEEVVLQRRRAEFEEKADERALEEAEQAQRALETIDDGAWLQQLRAPSDEVDAPELSAEPAPAPLHKLYEGDTEGAEVVTNGTTAAMLEQDDIKMPHDDTVAQSRNSELSKS